MKIVKIPLRCYGEKPPSFMRISRTGGLPMATIRGQTLSESNDIINLIEASFPSHKPLLPKPGSPQDARVASLMNLEVSR
jgi:glutathione S-transferase